MPYKTYIIIIIIIIMKTEIVFTYAFQTDIRSGTFQDGGGGAMQAVSGDKRALTCVLSRGSVSWRGRWLVPLQLILGGKGIKGMQISSLG